MVLQITTSKNQRIQVTFPISVLHEVVQVKRIGQIASDIQLAADKLFGTFAFACKLPNQSACFQLVNPCFISLAVIRIFNQYHAVFDKIEIQRVQRIINDYGVWIG